MGTQTVILWGNGGLVKATLVGSRSSAFRLESVEDQPGCVAVKVTTTAMFDPSIDFLVRQVEKNGETEDQVVFGTKPEFLTTAEFPADFNSSKCDITRLVRFIGAKPAAVLMWGSGGKVRAMLSASRPEAFKVEPVTDQTDCLVVRVTVTDLFNPDTDWLVRQASKGQRVEDEVVFGTKPEYIGVGKCLVNGVNVEPTEADSYAIVAEQVRRGLTVRTTPGMKHRLQLS